MVEENIREMLAKHQYNKIKKAVEDDPPLFVKLIKMLKDYDPKIRGGAAFSLGQIGDPRALRALRYRSRFGGIELIKDRHYASVGENTPIRTVGSIAKDAIDRILANLLNVEMDVGKVKFAQSHKISISIANRSNAIVKGVPLDFSDALHYFRLPKLVKFPPMKPGMILKSEIDLTPIFRGIFSFDIKIKNNFGESTKRFTIKVERETDRNTRVYE